MKYKPVLLINVMILLIIISCGGIRPTTFINYDYNYNYIERVAVIPFENLSKDQGAAARVTRIFTSELLSKNAFDIVEPGEVNRVLQKFGLVRTADLSKEQAIQIGKELQVQSLFLGSVNESSTMRSGSSNINIVTIVSRLVEVENGTTVWSATHTEGGRGFLASIFGGGNKSMSEVTRKCVKKLIGTVVD